MSVGFLGCCNYYVARTGTLRMSKCVIQWLYSQSFDAGDAKTYLLTQLWEFFADVRESRIIDYVPMKNVKFTV